MTAFKILKKIGRVKSTHNKLHFFCTALCFFLLIGHATFAFTVNTTQGSGVVGSPFNYAVTLTGATAVGGNNQISYSYKVNGPLPGGLSISATNGAITGTPTGTYNATISVTVTENEVLDGIFPQTVGSASAVIPIIITQSPPVITSGSTINGVINAAIVTYTITASGNPTSYSIGGGSGALPPGLILTGATISGIPTAAGTYTVTIGATNSIGTGTATLTIIIAAPVPVVKPGTVTGISGTAITNYTITATSNPTTYSASSLPPGLTLSGAVISGTPTISGTYNTIISATNASNETGTATLTFIFAPPAPVIAAQTANGAVASTFSYAIAASNNPTSYALQFGNFLPGGLTLNSATGVISGKPTAAGTFTFKITATNGSVSAPATITIIITPPVPVIQGNAVANAVAGNTFSYTFTAPNTSPNTYNATGLPAGLTIVSTTMGLISGTPSETGVFNVTLSATSAGITGTQRLTIIIPFANGTLNYVSKFTTPISLGNSLIYDDGSFVGIEPGGTGIPTKYGSYLLQVNGGAIFTQVVVKAFNNWPDFVFEDNYKLTPLAEIEQYINEHKHLPGVPSVADVKKDGMDVGVNQAVLLQKIEELTLYIIDQNKQIEAQKAATEEQNKKIAQLQDQNDQLQQLKKEVNDLKLLLQKN